MRQCNKQAKKGQAAIEFLVTYGWAILAVLITIGALAYFGFFNTTKYSPDTCELSPDIECIDASVRSDGVIQIALKNNRATSIDMMNVTAEWDYMTFDCYVNRQSTYPNIRPGQNVSIQCPLGRYAATNTKNNVKFSVFYSRNGTGNQPHEITGALSSTTYPVSIAGTCTDGIINCHNGGCEQGFRGSEECGGAGCIVCVAS